MEMQKLIELIADALNIDESTISPETRMKDDLGMDSLDVFEIVVEIENNLNITLQDEDIETIENVQDALDAINRALGA